MREWPCMPAGLHASCPCLLFYYCMTASHILYAHFRGKQVVHGHTHDQIPRSVPCPTILYIQREIIMISMLLLVSLIITAVSGVLVCIPLFEAWEHKSNCLYQHGSLMKDYEDMKMNTDWQNYYPSWISGGQHTDFSPRLYVICSNLSCIATWPQSMSSIHTRCTTAASRPQQRGPQVSNTVILGELYCECGPSWCVLYTTNTHSN